MEPKNLLLVHGANHGSWCWSLVRPLLEKRGFTVHAVDLPGRSGQRRSGWTYRLNDSASAVVEAADAAGGPVVAVGHSLGGMVISAAAQLKPELFSRLVYLTGFLPVNGDSVASLGRRDRHAILQSGIRAFLWKGRVRILPGPGADVFFADCTEEQRRWAFERLTDEPLRPSLERPRLTPDRFGTVPRSYIRCTKDRALSVAFQDEMIARQPCDRIATLESSHSPFLSMPDALAQAIVDVT
jgi:pimeloyl-ACP methyl ester carboxylesterase